jgi:hypothetical protein
MKNKKKLDQDELRQKVDGFSMEHNNNDTTQEGYKIVDVPLYKTHSADFDEIKDGK